MKKSIIALLLLSMLWSCKKTKQYSTWYVNGQKFTANDVGYSEGDHGSYLTSGGKANHFSIDFNTTHLPTHGSFVTKCNTPNLNHCCISLLYSSMGYVSSQNSTLNAAVVNNKIQYTIDSTWFYNESDNSDSILVKGVFNEP